MSDDPFSMIDRALVARHAALLERYMGASADDILGDISLLVQVAAFRMRQERALTDARAAVQAGASHECSEWVRDGACQVCGQAVAECSCRHCGHPASSHRGERGACVVEACQCGPGGWT